MLKQIVYIILLVVGLLMTGCISSKQMTHKKDDLNAPSNASNKHNNRPLNIILLIGDGMGITQMSAGMYSNNNRLNLERVTNIGLHKSYSADKLITDSAAGATAFACGVKTYNGAIGVNADTIPVRTILEEAEELGYKTGLVATSTIVHATPAAFISHNKYRKNYEEIASDFLKTDIDYFVGGGKKFFTRRKDDKNLYDDFRKKGYYVSDFFEQDLKDCDLTRVEKFAYLTSDKDPLPYAQGRTYLEEAAVRGVEFLSREDNPFFMMIEGSQIDWGGHANNSEYIISEMLEFDRVVGKVLDFAEKDGNTLVIITADHETGGYAIQKESTMNNIVGAFTSDYHTADLIPVYTYGPKARDFSGIFENTAIYHKMRAALGWK